LRRLSAFLIVALGGVLGAALGPAGAGWTATHAFGAGAFAEACRVAAEEERGDPSSLRACTEALEDRTLGTRDRAATLANRSVIFVNMKSFDMAVADCNRSLALVPDAGATFVNRGAARLGQGRYADALADIDRGLALHTAQPAKAWYNRGRAHEGLNDFAAAAEDYRHALLLLPDWTLPKERLAIVQANLTVK
jgi:tetratricopeptide (TPR) repeat protein